MTRQTDQPPLDQHLDALGTQLDGAVQRAERRRSRVGSGLAAAAVVVAVGLGALVALPGGERLDPVDRARAALAEDGGILHWVVVSVYLGPNDVEQPFDPTDSQWRREVWATTTGEARWRMVTPDPSGASHCGTQVWVDPRRPDVVVPLVSPTETAYAQGETSIYSPWSRAMVLQRRAPFGPRWTGPPVQSGLGDGDPRDLVQTIRGALDRGQLVDRGVTHRNGREVRRLEGTAPQTLPETTTPQAATMIANPNRLTYYVDANTFAPVELRVSRYSVWSRAGGYDHWKWITSIDHFLTFERLDDTATNRALLEITPAAGTKVTRLSAERAAARPRERLAPVIVAPPEDPAALARCKAALDTQTGTP